MTHECTQLTKLLKQVIVYESRTTKKTISAKDYVIHLNWYIITVRKRRFAASTNADKIRPKLHIAEV
jgi:hypothetical protein